MTTKWMWLAAALAAGIVACTDPESGGDDEPDPDPDPKEVCGDKVCRGDETATTCPADCGAPVTCGNKVCEAGEATTCPTDCAPQATCNNDVCEAGETFASCPRDCGARVRTQNNSSYTIYYLFLRRCTEAAWSTDQLSTSIPPGSAFTLTGIPPGCWYFKANDAGLARTWQSTTGVDLQLAQLYTWTLIN